MAEKRKRQARETRQRIVEETRRLIGEKGYMNVTVDDIANACGIAKGTLYHYFKGKEDIFIYIERDRFREAREKIDQMEIEDVEEKLKVFILNWFRCVTEDNLNLSKDWHRLAVELKVPSRDGRTHLDDDIDNVAAYLRDGIKAGKLREDMPVLSIAKDIVFSMYGASFYRCSSYSPFDVLQWAEDFTRDALSPHIAPYRK